MADVSSPAVNRCLGVYVHNEFIFEDFYCNRRAFTAAVLANMRRTGRGGQLSKTETKKGALANTGSNIVYLCACSFQLIARISKSVHYPGRIELLREHEESNLFHDDQSFFTPPPPEIHEMLENETFLGILKSCRTNPDVAAAVQSYYNRHMCHASCSRLRASVRDKESTNGYYAGFVLVKAYLEAFAAVNPDTKTSYKRDDKGVFISLVLVPGQV
jgi:hypothetical protein